LIAGVSFYFNYEAQIHIDAQTKEIQNYKAEIKGLNERLMTLKIRKIRKKHWKYWPKNKRQRLFSRLKILII
jgi:hypothetical protein